MSPISRPHDSVLGKQLSINTQKLKPNSHYNPDSAKPSRTKHNRMNFIDDNIDAGYDDNDDEMD